MVKFCLSTKLVEMCLSAGLPHTVAEHLILVEIASSPNINQELGDGGKAHATHAGRGAHGVSLDQTAENLGAFFYAQAIHIA